MKNTEKYATTRFTKFREEKSNIFFQNSDNFPLKLKIEYFVQKKSKTSNFFFIYFITFYVFGDVHYCGKNRFNLNFFPITLKVLELSEGRRGNLYMTANKNFVRFAHL